MNFLKMYCVHCKGVMVANGDKDILNCPYCGALFVVRQAVKDYQLNVGDSLDTQLHHCLEMPKSGEEAQRKIEYKVIEQPIITPFVNNDVANSDEDAVIDEAFLVNTDETFNQDEDIVESEEEQQADEIELPEADNTESEIIEALEMNDEDEQVDEQENEIDSEKVEFECVDVELDANDYQNEQLTDNSQEIVVEQEFELNEEVLESTNEENGSQEVFEEKVDYEEFVDPFATQTSFQEQVKELYYKAHPESAFELMEKKTLEPIAVEEQVVVVAPKPVREPKNEFTIVNGVLEAYDGDGDTATIPDEVTKINVSAFYSCKNLKNIIIGKNVQYISDGAFVHCTAIEKISIDRENQNYRSNGNCIIDARQRMLIFGCKNTVIPTDGSVLRIGAGAFADCIGLRSMHIPEGITSIGNSAFKNCASLTQVNIPASASYIALNAFEKTGLLDVSVSGGGLKKCLRCASEMPYGSDTCLCGCVYTIK